MTGVGAVVVLAAMVGCLMRGWPNRWTPLLNSFVLAGLIIPPAVVTTFWVVQGLGIYRTLGGLLFIEVAFGLSFCVMMTRAFVATIPRELDEAVINNGARPIRLFVRVEPAAAIGDRHRGHRALSSRPQATFRTRCTSCPATRTPPSS